MPTSAEAPATAPRPVAPRRFAAGLLLIVLGGGLAAFMSISVLLEMMTDDFFGMCVAGLVAFFGGLVARDGVYMVIGRPLPRRDATPSEFHRAHYARIVGVPEGIPPDPSRCAAVVYNEWQCPNPRGHGPAEAFCLKHARAHAAPAGT